MKLTAVGLTWAQAMEFRAVLREKGISSDETYGGLAIYSGSEEGLDEWAKKVVEIAAEHDVNITAGLTPALRAMLGKDKPIQE